MIKVFKNKVFDIISFIITIIGLLYLSNIFVSEYFDANNLRGFFKIPTFLKSNNFKLKEKEISKKKDIDDVFEVWTLKLSEYNQNNFINAKKEYKKLLDSGYRVYLKFVDNMYILYLGPELDKKKLEKYSKELFKKYNLNATIEDYKVNVSENDTVVVI